MGLEDSPGEHGCLALLAPLGPSPGDQDGRGGFSGRMGRGVVIPGIPRRMFGAAATISVLMCSATDSLDGRSPSSGAVDWTKALREHEGWLRKVLFARLRSPEPVDEVFEEVSLALARAGRATCPRQIGPWLYRVAVRQALLWRRARGRERRLHERYASKRRSSDVTKDPLEWLIMEERRELVRGALGRLPSRAAEVLILKYGEDLSYSELSARLGLSESAVESRLHRARRLLRNELSATGEQGEYHEG